MGIAEDIKTLRIQGADNIAVESLKHLLRFSEKNGFGLKFDREMERLRCTRTTAVVLHNCIEMLKRDKSRNNIIAILERIRESRRLIASNGEKLIKNDYIVHTHCHSSEVVGIIRLAASKKKFTVIADETRPIMQGLITVKELSTLKNVSTVLITDSAAGMALSGRTFRKPNMVLVGCDAIRKEGLVNKLGTYMLCVSAKENKIPVYSAASTIKTDRRKAFSIEERHVSEVCKIKIPKRVTVRNPAFDITPWKYVDALITEKGLIKPQKIIRTL